MSNPRREHEPETVWRAQELYCLDRLPFDAVARITGVASSTLKRWADKYDWRAKKEEIARAESDIRADTVLARAGMLKALIETRNAQTGFAVAALESLALRQAEAARNGVEDALPQREISDDADVVQALQEAVRRRLELMVRDGVNAEALKEVKDALGLIKTLQPTEPETNAGPKPLSATSAEILRKVLAGDAT